jgi:hypothetical protein
MMQRFGARMRTVDLSPFRNWPGSAVPKEKFWRDLAERARGYPAGRQAPWGVRFNMARSSGPRVILLSARRRTVTIPLSGSATHLCFLHAWHQLPGEVRWTDPTEGLVVAEYIIRYADGTEAVLPVRSRFEVMMTESPGPPWRAVGFTMPQAEDPAAPPDNVVWGPKQTGVAWQGPRGPAPLLCVLANPQPRKKLRAIVLRGLCNSPLLVSGLTLYEGADNPLRHLPRRTYRVKLAKPDKVTQAKVDLGVVTQIERTTGLRGARWLSGSPVPISSPPFAWGRGMLSPDERAEDVIEIVAANDATVTVGLEKGRQPLRFSLGEAFHKGRSASGSALLEVLGRDRQWMQVTVVDRSTGRPTSARVHFSGPRGEYIAPYGHHAQVNPNWFEDYGADVVYQGRNFAYVQGRFTTDLPVGDVYVEIWKGFEYRPVRALVRIRPGQKELKLGIGRWKDLRREGWVTADTHVHFISPHTAWLEGQAEGVNVVNLLASQWGRLFTNVGDIIGKPNVVEGDTIVYVGTENRNHMLGHMSMLGTQGLPVYPMCCGGVSESYVGDPDFRMMAEWALENRRKGGVVIRPHFPGCGHTEDPVPILKGLVDALEIRSLRGTDFPTQEWYRYLNCGYRVAVCGGTDKMSAGTTLGWIRTYAKLDRDRPLTYDAWARAVRAGRTFATTGPVLDLRVEGRGVGDTISMRTGGTLELSAVAECMEPLGTLEVVLDGRVVAMARGRGNTRKLAVRDKVRVEGSSWIAARCSGAAGKPGGFMAAHTSPIYIRCGGSRPFDGPAAEHMLALVEGGIEYLNNLATVYDERSRERMVRLFNEARQELSGRLLVEARHKPHHAAGAYHTHGRGAVSDHRH